MADQAILKLIQDDIKSIKSQIDILRMETKAHQLEALTYLLDLAWQEARNFELPEFEACGAGFGPLTLH